MNTSRPFLKLLALVDVDKHPRAVDYCQTVKGRTLLFLVFTILMMFTNPFSFPVPLVAAICAVYAFAGERRHAIMPLLTFIILLCGPFWFDKKLLETVTAQQQFHALTLLQLRWCGLGLFFVFAAVVMHCTYRFKNHAPFNRPVLSLILLFFTLVAVAVSPLLHGFAEVMLWSFIDCYSAYCWFLGYALLERNRNNRAPVWMQFGMFHPFWGSSSTPYGKGMANVRSLEKNTAQELAVCQIKGVKLAAWCVLVRLVLTGFTFLIYGYLGIPHFDDAFIKLTQFTPYSRLQCWACLIAAFFEMILYFTVWCNLFIACARMAGVRLLQGSYKPLLAKSIAEFWNRYIFYFKELLVEFFFYPTFTRCFKQSGRFRIMFATFVAVSIGNILYHFMRDISYVPTLGLANAITGFETYAFYTLLLTAGIVASQLAPKTPTDAGWVRKSLFPFLRIAIFFSLLHIFDDIGRTYSLAQHLDFLWYITGLK